MNYLMFCVFIPWIRSTSSQRATIATTQVKSFGLEFTLTAGNTSALNATKTSFTPREIVNRSLPVPTGLKKKSATTTKLFLHFSPPANYLDDVSYSHFRIDYENQFEKQSVELKKNLNFEQIILPGLQSGVLYIISVRTQGRDAQGNYVLSIASETIKARTIPLPVFNLQIAQDGNSKNVAVTWDGSPTPPRGPKYDLFTLSYKIITKLSSEQRSVYKAKSKNIERKRSNTFTSTSGKNVSETVQIELGAEYLFSVVTRSTGEDATESLPEKTTKWFPIPGPVNIKKFAHSKTSISIEWETFTDVKNISQHILTYRRVYGNGSVGANKGNNVTVVAGVKQCNITGLTPGALYLVTIKSLRTNMPFGKESEAATIYARTAPLSPNVTVFQVGTSDVTLTVGTMNSGEATSINVTYEMVTSNLTFSDMQYNLRRKEIKISGLVPGQLYRLTITLSSLGSLEVDKTSTSITELIRTTPRPPQSFTGSGKQGKILLQWLKPEELVAPTFWRYEIVYYQVTLPNKVTRVPVWNRNGGLRLEYSLERLLPGTLYEIFIYCEVGQDTANNRVARSDLASPLRLYTQPDKPDITMWTQVTLTQVEIQWSLAEQSFASFDYYLLNLTRLYSAASAIEFMPESLSYRIDKSETRKILKLSFGSKYRTVLTTVIGEGETWMQSVVVIGNNSKIFETWSPYDSHQLFSRCVWRFTTCGGKEPQTGRFGPNQVFCNAEYSSTTLKNLVLVKEGIQRWMAPIEGLYRITAAGAGYQDPGGLGAIVSGLFHLTEGSTLHIAVGQKGYSEGAMTTGGAGGSFVISADDKDEPLVVAGGAGSAYGSLSFSPIANGRLNHTAGDASETGQGFGQGGLAQTLGPGMPGNLNTAGGAGFRGTSKSAVNIEDRVFEAAGFLPFYGKERDVEKTDETPTIPFIGGRYERENGDYSDGGFGGGGNGYINAAGGGGGYTGGGGGPPNGYSGGGGSYIKFTGGTQYAEILNPDSGYVEVTLVGLPASPPIPVTLYLVVAFLVGIGLTLCFGGLLCWVDKCVGRRLSGETPPKHKTLLPDVTTVSPEYYETSVHVTDTSHSMSGLYVRDIPDQEELSYRKYSEVDSYDEMPHSSAQLSVPPRIMEVNESDDNHMRRERGFQRLDRDGFDNAAYSENEDPASESTPSAVSSYRSDIDKITNDVYAWDIQEEENQSSSFESSESERSSLPPPPTPPPPPLDGTATEEQKEKFKRSLKMFHDEYYY